MGHESPSQEKLRLNHSFIITRCISLIYFRIRTLNHVYIGCERKGNIDTDHVSKDNDLTSERRLLND